MFCSASPLKAIPICFWKTLHHFQHLFSCSPIYQHLEKFFTIAITLIQTLPLSYLYPHPATSLLTKTKQDGYFPKVSYLLGGVPIATDHTTCQKQSRLSQHICVFAHTVPDSHTTPELFLVYPAARNPSNSSFNTPIFDYNEKIVIFCLPQRQFPMKIFGRVIRGSHHKYLPCSLLLRFSSHSRLISDWNKYLRWYLAIYLVILLEKTSPNNWLYVIYMPAA